MMFIATTQLSGSNMISICSIFCFSNPSEHQRPQNPLGKKRDYLLVSCAVSRYLTQTHQLWTVWVSHATTPAMWIMLVFLGKVRLSRATTPTMEWTDLKDSQEEGLHSKTVGIGRVLGIVFIGRSAATLAASVLVACPEQTNMRVTKLHGILTSQKLL
jgi:hypothetical protein